MMEWTTESILAEVERDIDADFKMMEQKRAERQPALSVNWKPVFLCALVLFVGIAIGWGARGG